MNQAFLRLISILIGKEPGHLISNDQEKLHDLSRRFNEALQINRVEEEFHTEMLYDNQTYLIPPVPFASTNKDHQPLSFAFLGLNPKLFLEDDTTIQEKLYAGETWEQYGLSYTTNFRNEPNIGSFYRKLTVLMESLKNKRLTPWTEIVHGCKTPHQKLDRYLKIVEQDPILVGEFIPLHSSEIGAYDKKTIQLLFQEVPEYKPYLTELFTTISVNLGPDGWLISNGKGASAALEIFIENNMINGNFKKILDKSEEAYTCYVWEHDGVSRKVLLLHQFLGTIGGKLNSNKDIGKMVINVVNAFDPSLNKLEMEKEMDKIWGMEEQTIDNEHESFGEYASIAERIDQYILNSMSDPAYRMLNVRDGVAYHKDSNKMMFGFAKLSNTRDPFLILRFGRKSTGDHIGIVKQIEFDRKLGHQIKRNINHIYKYPSEAFIYLKNLAEYDSDQIWEFVEENIQEAYRVYYKS